MQQQDNMQQIRQTCNNIIYENIIMVFRWGQNTVALLMLDF